MDPQKYVFVVRGVGSELANMSASILLLFCIDAFPTLISQNLNTIVENFSFWEEFYFLNTLLVIISNKFWRVLLWNMLICNVVKIYKWRFHLKVSRVKTLQMNCRPQNYDTRVKILVKKSWGKTNNDPIPLSLKYIYIFSFSEYLLWVQAKVWH